MLLAHFFSQRPPIAISIAPVHNGYVAGNAGPANAPFAQVSDNFPAPLINCSWTCTGQLGASCGPGSGSLLETVDLPVGGSVTYLADCQVDPNATIGAIANTAGVATQPGVAELNTSDNQATDTDFRERVVR